MSPELTEFSDLIDEQFDIADMDTDDFVSYILSLFAWVADSISCSSPLSGVKGYCPFIITPQLTGSYSWFLLIISGLNKYG